ncbi:hypothetical protein EYF80_032392 [Liparis tanakae]|uniref:Uncharacterized protein n=1 Tax=Liparis tanakae TaxID=230148 RepID=A0A4Z2GXC3_9TELE|nr:hypothetical protein EYF80_032392 [Liparis tanakae]
MSTKEYLGLWAAFILGFESPGVGSRADTVRLLGSGAAGLSGQPQLWECHTYNGHFQPSKAHHTLHLPAFALRRFNALKLNGTFWLSVVVSALTVGCSLDLEEIQLDASRLDKLEEAQTFQEAQEGREIKGLSACSASLFITYLSTILQSFQYLAYEFDESDTCVFEFASNAQQSTYDLCPLTSSSGTSHACYSVKVNMYQ